ncbi:MAG: DNA polymerase-1 [Candidatus Omnitrophota bacterium]|jgi:DNA polymerase-1
MKKKQLFILDGHALCYRAFYAVRELTNSKGQPTNAVFGFVNIFRKLLKNFEPTHMVACFDSKGPTFRHDMYKEYKSQRSPMPDELRSQIPIIKDLLKAYHVSIVEQVGYEADDLIAGLAQRVSSKDMEVVIVSEDKDLYQLFNDYTKFFSVRQDKLLDQAMVTKKLGFEATRIVDFIGMAGDKADNIPGVVGVGEVTARNLINEFGSLEDIYANLDKIEKVKVRAKMERDRENALFSKELALLVYDKPVDIDVESFEWQDPDRDKLFEMYKDLEFKRWADEYAQEMMPEVTVAIDIKPFDLNVLKGKKQVSILFKEELIYLATQRDEIYQISLDQIETLKSLFEDDKIVKVVYDVKELIKLCRIKNITLNNIFDCLLAGYIASPTGSNEIKDFAWNFLKEAIEDIKPEQEVGILFELYAWLNKTLKEQDLMKLYDELEFPLAQVIATMESEGVMLDLKFLKDMSVMCEGTISKLTTELYKEAGEEFNINSPKQLSTILFEKLGLPVIKKTKTGFSTDESVLSIAI